MVEKLRAALVAAGERPTVCAWFRAAEADPLGRDVHLRDDAGARVSVAAGPLGLHSLRDRQARYRIDLGTHLAVDVTEDRVSVWADKVPRTLGRLLATYRRGSFRATCVRYDGRVDLTIDDEVNGPTHLIGLWSPEHDECLVTALAVEAMANRRD